MRGRGVRAHAARVPLCAPDQRRRDSRRRWLGCELAEPGERLAGGVGVEELEARLEAVGSEDAEPSKVMIAVIERTVAAARVRSGPSGRSSA
jgi:hypothetical protein